jgi:hypothetical protein
LPRVASKNDVENMPKPIKALCWTFCNKLRKKFAVMRIPLSVMFH